MVTSLMDTGIDHDPPATSRAGLASSGVLSLLMISALCVCLRRRIQATRSWTTVLSIRDLIILVIYADSIMFIVATAILAYGLGVNLNAQTCSSAILLCLLCYMSTKFIYFYLIEKIYITRKLHESRLKSKLYCFNLLVVLVPYCLIIVLNIIYRISYFSPEGMCIIGVQSGPLIVFIIFDAAVNLYLTLLFVVPLRAICANSQARNPLLRIMCHRSLLSSILTLLTTTTNLAVLLALHGEPAWIFLLSCNFDVVFAVLIRRWVTLKGPSTISNSRDVRVDEITRAALSFSSSQTAQDGNIEGNGQEFVINEHGKVSEVEIKRASCASDDKDIENGFSSTYPEVPTKVQISPESLDVEEICSTSTERFDGEIVAVDDEEESDVESLGRAIITTHISAQKMDDCALAKFPRHHSSMNAKFGGIRVLIEHVVEVEYESDLGP